MAAGAPYPGIAAFCTRCGRSLAPGGAFCTGCGAPAGPGPMAVAMQSSPYGIPPPAYPGAAYGTAPRPPQRSMPIWSWILIGVVIALVVGATVGSILYFEEQVNNVFAVRVTVVNWSGSNPCGELAGQAGPGFFASKGGTTAYTTSAYNPSATASCTLHSVTSATPGFAVVSSNTPLTLGPGRTATLSLNLTVPNETYFGALTLSVT